MNTVSTVYVLGAGFSRAISDNMPLLRDLSRRVHEQMDEAGHWAPEWGASLQEDVELLATHLLSRHPWETPEGRHQAMANYFRVTDHIETALVSAEVGTMATPPPEWLTALCNHWLDNDAAVVTFNYDTLVERTVALGPNGQAIASSLFSAPITPANARFGAPLASSRTDRRFTLLKLHGSLNWWYSGPESPPGDVVYGTGLHAQWNEYAWTQATLAPVADKRRLIVPPTLNKGDYFTNGVLRHQWRVAREALSQAEQIVFIGYSLPMSDLTAALLIDTAQTGCPVEVVDYRPDAHRSIQDRLPGFKVEQRFSGDAAVAEFSESLWPEVVG